MMEGYAILSLFLCLSVASAFSNNVRDGVRDGDVRLAGTGSSERMGRVEVFRGGEWGTVCDDEWGLKDAGVVCTQLGYSYGASDFTTDAREFGQGSGKIFLNDVSCTGFEDRITDCPALWSTLGRIQCSHNKDAGVKCIGCTVDSDCEQDGKCNVDMYCDCPPGYYGPNCRDAICAMDSDCEHDGTCNMDTSMCMCTSGYSGDNCEWVVRDGDVRLAGAGSSANQGRVEVYDDGEWGTVCSDLWDIQNALVVCKQLGFPGATASGARFGEGTGPILLDNVECEGNETSIMECRKNPIRSHNCFHDEDAGVICQEVNIFTDSKRQLEDVEFYLKKEEQMAAEEESNDKKEADLKKKDVLQALSDLLAELKDK